MNARDRITSHLRRILVAAGVAMPAVVHGDTSTPKPPGDPNKDEKPKNPDGKKPKERERLGYEVVDMLPPPYIEEKETGKLEVHLKAPRHVLLIDGKAPDGKSPWKLTAGTHVVTVADGDKKVDLNVLIEKNKTNVVRSVPAPSPAPKATKP